MQSRFGMSTLYRAVSRINEKHTVAVCLWLIVRVIIVAIAWPTMGSVRYTSIPFARPSLRSGNPWNSIAWFGEGDPVHPRKEFVCRLRLQLELFRGPGREEGTDGWDFPLIPRRKWIVVSAAKVVR